MLKPIVQIFAILILVLIPGLPLYANTDFDYFINEYNIKRIEANKLLKALESDLKKGNNEKICSRQRQAAKIGLEANKSLLKAYEIIGGEIPTKTLESSKKTWLRILEKC